MGLKIQDVFLSSFVTDHEIVYLAGKLKREMQAPFYVMSSNSMAAVTLASCLISTRFFC